MLEPLLIAEETVSNERAVIGRGRPQRETAEKVANVLQVTRISRSVAVRSREADDCVEPNVLAGVNVAAGGRSEWSPF